MKVSVIIPCFNVEKYIERCLDSVSTQNYKNLEVICVNDGSTDNTFQLIEKYKLEKQPELILLTQDNMGATTARNKGLSVATGEYIQFLDADDTISKDKILNQINIAKETQADLIVGSYEKISEANDLLYKKEYVEQKTSPWILLLKTDLGNTVSNLFSKRILELINGWKEGLGSSQEYELMFRILKKTNLISFDPQVNTTIYQRKSGSISQTNLEENWARYVDLRVSIIHYIKEQNIDIDINKAYQILFDAIRILYSYYPSKAKLLYKKEIPEQFKPKKSPATGSGYLVLFRLLGFEYTEKIRLIFKGIK